MCGIVLVLTLAAYGGPYQLYRAIGGAAKGIRDSRSRIQFLEDAAKRAKANETSLSANAALLSQIQSAFFDEQNPLSFIETMERLAKVASVGLDIELANPSERPPHFRLTVLGDAGSLLAFLRMLENVPVVVSLRTMTFDVVSTPPNPDAAKGKLLPQAAMVLLVSGLTPK
ncbi:MAG: hypothetical protein HY471_00315 [Candidatus Sungbacteria bacterium]|nr:hypothetical protein [Candidatus Sungbacteria bacterium]